MPVAPQFVDCQPCRARRRIGRAVSICRTCSQALCEKHLEACACPPWMQLGLGGVA